MVGGGGRLKLEVENLVTFGREFVRSLVLGLIILFISFLFEKKIPFFSPFFLDLVRVVNGHGWKDPG